MFYKNLASVWVNCIGVLIYIMGSDCMSGMEKRLNKWLATIILGGTLISLGKTPKGKVFMKKILSFLQSGITELKKNIK